MIPLITFSTGLGDAISVVLSPNELAELTNTETGTTAVITATPSGGSGSYSYAWTFIGELNGNGFFQINDPALAATDLDYSNLLVIGDFVEGILQCIVTDTLSNTGFANIYVTVGRVS